MPSRSWTVAAVIVVASIASLNVAVTLAAVLSRADRASAPRALQVYEALRHERCARIQRNARVNGARYDATDTNLDDRNRQLGATARERAWIWNHDAEAEALKTAASL